MKEFLKKELVRLYRELGKIPTKRDVGTFLYSKARQEYGTWNNALYAVFGEINRVYKTDKNIASKLLLEFYKEHKRIPRANENSQLTCAVQSAFKTWNKGLESVFGNINQIRYNSNVWVSVLDFIEKYKRLPLREEFDGVKYPYWQAVTRSLNVKKWSEIYTIMDISKIKYFHNSKMGTGKIFVDSAGIVYFSRKEFLIGEWLRKNNIEFEKEIPYGNCNYVFDFYLPKYKVYIEYYGLMGYKNYSLRVEDKRRMYNGRKVIEILKHDNVINKLSQEVQRL